MNKHSVLITGASRGIGLAIAKLAAKQGWHVIGISRTQGDEAFPGVMFHCDLSDTQATEVVLNDIVQKHSVLAVVNNVGMVAPQRLIDLELDVLANVLDLNVRVAAQVVQKCIPAMKAHNFGRIVNISSRAVDGSEARTSYAAAKSALLACTNTWAIELADYGITVNSVVPGPIETELFHQARPKGSAGEKKAIERILLKRLGTANDVAQAAVFFLAQENSFITGQHLGVDGGFR